jgi:hypothetical protein
MSAGRMDSSTIRGVAEVHHKQTLIAIITAGMMSGEHASKTESWTSIVDFAKAVAEKIIADNG